jgi:glycosyltransferase involved in cell wall biosynthesis
VRILYLHQYFHTPAVPGSIRSYEMARRFVAWGHEVDLITSDRNPQPGQTGWRTTDEAGIRVHWLPVPYSNSLGVPERIRAFFKFAIGAARRAADIEADLVFATSTPLTIALPAVYAAKRQRIPMVFEVRDLWPELPIAIGALKGWLPITSARWLERFAYRNARHVVALSPGMKAGVVRTGYPAERVHVIPNSADIDLFKVPPEAGAAFRAQHTWLGDRPLVVYVGTLGEINGVSYLAELAAKVRPEAPEVRFLVVGGGRELEKVRARARELGVLGVNFYMLPKVPKAEVPSILSAATFATSLFIDLKEMWHNSANKFFDGLASGTPMLINYGGWQAEMLKETGAGLVLPPDDLEAAKTRLLGALADKAWLEAAGRRAFELAKTRFSRDLLARDLMGVLERAYAESRSQSNTLTLHPQ